MQVLGISRTSPLQQNTHAHMEQVHTSHRTVTSGPVGRRAGRLQEDMQREVTPCRLRGLTRQLTAPDRVRRAPRAVPLQGFPVLTLVPSLRRLIRPTSLE